jgi:predicted cupin superfamily sugar epimerase
MADAAQLIRALGLQPHPDGGHFKEAYRAPGLAAARSAVTSIYYLLRAGERAAWHRIDAVELWHHYAGAPLKLQISEDGERVAASVLGADMVNGERPLAVVPDGAWQSAESLGDWSLVGCTVAPAFEPTSLEMAPAGWSPGKRQSSSRTTRKPKM